MSISTPTHALERLARLNSLIAIVDVHGNIQATNRPEPEANLLDLLSDRDRDSVRALLLSCGFSTQPTRVQVIGRDGRSGWMELASAGQGEVCVVWLPAEVVAPAATPAPVPRVRRRPPRTVVHEYAIVADPEHREIAANLRRALDEVSEAVGVWIVPDVKGNLGAASDTRIIILGDSRYTGFLRKLAGEPDWAHHGVCWSRKGRRAAVWYRDPGGDFDQQLAEHEAALDAFLLEVASARKDTTLVQTFLQGFELGPVQRRLSQWPRRVRYVLGVGRFLLDGFPQLAAGSSTSSWRD